MIADHQWACRTSALPRPLRQGPTRRLLISYGAHSNRGARAFLGKYPGSPPDHCAVQCFIARGQPLPGVGAAHDPCASIVNSPSPVPRHAEDRILVGIDCRGRRRRLIFPFKVRRRPYYQAVLRLPAAASASPSLRGIPSITYHPRLTQAASACTRRASPTSD